jgi:hypothetical protein
MLRATGLFVGIGLAALAGCVGSIGGEPGNDENGEVESSMCVVDTPLRRLTRFEYNNTVRDLLGDTTNPANAFPPEADVGGFDNQAAALTASELLIEQYMKAAEGISERATTNLSTLLPDCSPATDGEAECGAHFIATFGKRAFRRPLTDDETARFQALFDFATADPDMGTFEDGIQLVIQGMLQSSQFLYRPEFGEADPVDVDVVRLTHWEMASKLSYMIWNTMPDDTLLAAAQAQQLGTKDEIAAQARRMLAHDRAKDAIRNFHRQWLRLAHLDTISKDTTVYPAYSDALRPMWKEEIERFIEHVVLEDDGKLGTLFTAPYSFLNADLASFYGDDVVGPAPGGAAFEKVSMDPAHRAGLLTQGALMAVHAEGNQSSPVFRGKFVREQLLCQTLPLPPANLVIEPPELDPSKTTREQFEEIGANPDCASCHALMNPIGFGFENFDGVGLWRDTQNGKPIDNTGEITATESLDGTFAGPIDLAGKLAQSPEVASCVSSQWFRFAYNRTVTPDDACNLDVVNEAFAASGYDIRELIVALTQTETFLHRHQVVVEGGAP